jgi:F0F1-type ATP synthase assembly protein I
VYDQISSNKFRSVLLVVAFMALVVLVGWFFGRFTGLGNWGLLIALVIADHVLRQLLVLR